MNIFFRKFILHKYSELISDIGKRPLFIISEEQVAADKLIHELNRLSDFQLAQDRAPLLHHIGSLSYHQYLGPEATDYQKASMLKDDKLEEQLRKLSFKNTMGNNYGFEINPIKRSDAKHLKKSMQNFRWGTQIYPDETTFKGLKYLFPKMKAIYFYQNKNQPDGLKYLFSYDDCLCIPTDNEDCVKSVLGFL